MKDPYDELLNSSMPGTWYTCSSGSAYGTQIKTSETYEKDPYDELLKGMPGTWYTCTPGSTYGTQIKISFPES